MVRLRVALSHSGVSQPAAWSLGAMNLRQASASVINSEAPLGGQCHPLRSGRVVQSFPSTTRQVSIWSMVVADFRDIVPELPAKRRPSPACPGTVPFSADGRALRTGERSERPHFVPSKVIDSRSRKPSGSRPSFARPRSAGSPLSFSPCLATLEKPAVSSAPRRAGSS